MSCSRSTLTVGAVIRNQLIFGTTTQNPVAKNVQSLEACLDTG